MKTSMRIILLGLVALPGLFVLLPSSVLYAVDEKNVPNSTSPLGDFVARIIVADKLILKDFVKLLKSPTGEIVMADRAAIQAQNASDNSDSESQWEKFLAKHFEKSAKTWSVKTFYAKAFQSYVATVRVAEEELVAVSNVLAEAAASMEVKEQDEEKTKVASLFKRFLEHPSSPAFIYDQELRSQLHPDIDDLAEQFQEFLVRSPTGVYVARPARRNAMEKRLTALEKTAGPLLRLEKELSAWADDLIKRDKLHEQFAGTISLPEYAKYLIFEHLSDEGQLRESELEGVFGQLEEATLDTESGLKLETESDQFKEMQENIGRFQVIWDYRDALREPLFQLSEKVDPLDELHIRLKAFLKTDMALFFVAQRMDYLPVQAEVATHQWLSRIVTKSKSGKYELTVESTEDLKNRINDFYRESRDVRRRGRLIDEFAANLGSQDIRKAMESVTGKLLLEKLIEKSSDRPQVDGLQLWFDEFFDETADGLALKDWAEPAISEVLSDAAALEKELSKSDF